MSTPWHDAVERLLPPPEQVRKRNAAITAAYARWYLQSPQLFKWAGAAAFASHRVGLALSPYETIEVLDGVVSAISGGLFPDLIKQDIDLLRETNNLVYADVAWAHAAYADEHGGLDAVIDGLHGRAGYGFMRQGFRDIDRGRRLLASGREREAQQLIWRGNYYLLRHEQWCTVQPQFAKMLPGSKIFFSTATTMDYDARNLRIDWKTGTWFPLFMYTRGALTLLRTLSLPDISNPLHRWQWVSRRVLPIWRRVDRRDRTLKEKFALLLGEPPGR